ncbi:hypothetical protein PVOR_12250 [Paenibacillus vortex V453]|uniref:Uncharacterized protein n=1 Tax=Paenibacillus vortex V453 TaxID=715225 RepID=A0A2R9SWH3_9BACL|nr:hypothetical protein PVOR_12250 [Paenibacillus vortex V453]
MSRGLNVVETGMIILQAILNDDWVVWIQAQAIESLPRQCREETGG